MSAPRYARKRNGRNPLEILRDEALDNAIEDIVSEVLDTPKPRYSAPRHRRAISRWDRQNDPSRFDNHV